MEKDSSASLRDYEAKRDPGATPEPFGQTRITGGSLFVVHHHLARREHYDLRLEIDGVLWSWAVPKGPSYDQQDKRLAIHVETHPLDYAWFEDRIPEGQYGAGAMVIWDRGRWKSKGDPKQGFKDGKLLFELVGHKLHGLWTLVKTTRSKNEWLLIKERDAWMRSGVELPMDSVVSGETAADLKAGKSKAEALDVEVGVMGKRARSDDYRHMLCEPSEPFDDPQWLFEIKYDGFRVFGDKDGDQVRLITRAGRDIAKNLPEVTEALAALPFNRLVIDGEIVVYDPQGLPSFPRLLQRGQLQRALDIAMAAVRLPAQLMAFDLIRYADRDLTGVPLVDRKSLLRRVLPSVGICRYVEHEDEHGVRLFESAETMGLEGLVAKRRSSLYEQRRSANWLKIAVKHTEEFTVFGWTMDKNGHGLGAVYVAALKGNQWVNLGRVGSGLSVDARASLLEALKAIPSKRPLVTIEDAKPGTQWVRLQIVVEVDFKEFSKNQHLRQPVLVAVRPDKTPEECVNGPWENDDISPAVVTETLDRPRVIVSNRDKIYFPAHGADGSAYTKGQVVDYYRAIAPYMLPYLADRPIVLTRYPDGIDGESFFQHRAPDYLPQFIRRERVRMDSDGEEKPYIVVDNEDTLVYLANLGTLPIHVFASSCVDPQHPDYLVLDLDPKEAPFEHVVEVAAECRDLLSAIGLPHFLKTTGSSGLHVMVPLNRALSHDQARGFAEILARHVVKRRPDIATIQRSVELREGRVYVDYMQNGDGKTIAAAYCVRPVPSAAVSMPLAWDELGAGPQDFTIANALDRVTNWSGDPMSGLLTSTADISAAIDRLAEQP